MSPAVREWLFCLGIFAGLVIGGTLLGEMANHFLFGHTLFIGALFS